MNARSLCVVALTLTACDPPVTATQVNGSAVGISFASPKAVSVTDTDLVGGTRRTIFFADGLQCADLKKLPLDLGPSALLTADGGRLPLLIVGGQTLLDTGRGSERLRGTTSNFVLQGTRSDGALTGRFTASFTTDLDGGALPDGGIYGGEFIAPPCASASAGCEVTPVGTFAFLGVAFLFLRRKKETPSPS